MYRGMSTVVTQGNLSAGNAIPKTIDHQSRVKSSCTHFEAYQVVYLVHPTLLYLNWLYQRVSATGCRLSWMAAM